MKALTLGRLGLRRAVLVALALWAGAAHGRIEVSREPGRTVIDVKVEGLALSPEARSGYVRATLQGVEGREGVLYEVGHPEIPVVRFLVTGEVSVEVGDAEVSTLAEGVRVWPAQAPLLKVPGVKEEFKVVDAAYADSGRYPAKPYTLTPAGSLRGEPQVLVTLHPFQYEPASGAYRLTRSFRVTVRGLAQQASERETFAFVVGERFAQNAALAAYKALKERLGYHVETIVVTPGMTPEAIRQALKELYANAGLVHALIVGDAADVPAKRSSIISGVTDHYYRAIDTDNYASDINGPDIGVGRLSVQTEEQLEAVLAKLTRYVEGRFSRETWLNGIAFIATDDQYRIAEGSHNYAINNYTAPAGYLGVFPQPEQLGGDKLYAITHRVSNAKVHEVLGMGRTVINYSGHGSTTSWAGPRVTQADVRALSDLDAMPFVISNACITGDFRVSESFGETWIRHPAGAIMFWGSMDSTYWNEDDVLERAMWDGIMREGMRSFAEITNYALARHWAHYGGAGLSKYYWETYVTFGDPSLTLRTGETKDVRLVGPSTLPIGATSVEYRVVDAAGEPVANARVGLSLETGGGFKAAAVTDAEGRARLDIQSATRTQGEIAVAVTGQNLALAEATLAIVP